MKKIEWTTIKNNKSEKESNLLKLNSIKASKILSWQPILKFNETTKMITEWYKNYYTKNSKTYNFSKKQIEEYSLKLEKLKRKNFK